MTHVSVRGTIPASADTVWKNIGSFREIEKYLPLIKSSVTEGHGLGAKRTCEVTTPDGQEATINEQITDFNDTARSLTYELLGVVPFQFENYKGTMKVTGTGDNTCEVEWSCTFDAKGPEADLTKMMRDVYTFGINGLKQMYSS